ncbi:uncharacterized protein CTRU02_207771 [Colletotrichum truncatum]|uniref:Uncharacterized protein n=1 Tax=Colletotrichum truncatum TaxID=5467 RepID=A0ACC3Z241_COLTU|nr:uncharacterized protein CTRU02_09129 [Colletotrichum truncatum]KAF6788808.1 hypothetical protein CTRU02_09129 [Colletotrichum truncatum]
MKLLSALTLSATSLAVGTLAAPAPEPATIGATVKPYRMLCAGFNAGSFLTSGDIRWAMEHRRDELDLKAGWWDVKDLKCTATYNLHTPQDAVAFTYNHLRNNNAMTTMKYQQKVLCGPMSGWKLDCH